MRRLTASIALSCARGCHPSCSAGRWDGKGIMGRAGEGAHRMAQEECGGVHANACRRVEQGVEPANSRLAITRAKCGSRVRVEGVTFNDVHAHTDAVEPSLPRTNAGRFCAGGRARLQVQEDKGIGGGGRGGTLRNTLYSSRLPTALIVCACLAALPSGVGACLSDAGQDAYLSAGASSRRTCREVRRSKSFPSPALAEPDVRQLSPKYQKRTPEVARSSSQQVFPSPELRGAKLKNVLKYHLPVDEHEYFEDNSAGGVSRLQNAWGAHEASGLFPRGKVESRQMKEDDAPSVVNEAFESAHDSSAPPVHGAEEAGEAHASCETVQDGGGGEWGKERDDAVLEGSQDRDETPEMSGSETGPEVEGKEAEFGRIDSQPDERRSLDAQVCGVSRLSCVLHMRMFVCAPMRLVI